MRLGGESDVLLVERGSRRFRIGRTEAAIQDFARAAALSPRLHVAHFNLGVALGSAGRFAQAAEALDRALRIDPGHAQTRYQLALALYADRRTDRAREECDRLERMVGREDTLKDLSARLLSDRFVTLRGPGGIGKTTVAVALAHDMLTAFEGHVYFLDLGPLRDATLVASSVAAALGLVVHHADPTDSIIAFLRDRRLLLVLDSCEHVIDVVAALAENIHQRAPNVSILATSRESLLVQGEQIFELVPLQAPPQGTGLSLREALSYPAVRLFMERATAAGHRSAHWGGARERLLIHGPRALAGASRALVCVRPRRTTTPDRVGHEASAADDVFAAGARGSWRPDELRPR